MQGKRKQQRGLNPKRCQHQSPRVTPSQRQDVKRQKAAAVPSAQLLHSVVAVLNVPQVLFRQLEEEEMGRSLRTKESRSTERGQSMDFKDTDEATLGRAVSGISNRVRFCCDHKPISHDTEALYHTEKASRVAHEAVSMQPPITRLPP